jgi:hypothetical protein
VWPNLLIEAIKSRAGHLGQLSPNRGQPGSKSGRNAR